MEKGYENIEAEVMDAIFKDRYKFLKKLRTQYQYAKVTNRKRSPVGLFIIYSVPKSLQLSPPISFTLGNNILIEMPHLKNGIGSVLYIDDGLINMLELFTFGEEWPDKVANITISRQTSDKKKMLKIESKIQT